MARDENLEVGKKDVWKNLLRLVVLLFVIGLSTLIIINHRTIEEFIGQIGDMGYLAYPAIFAASIVANATIIIPVPGVALTAISGAFFTPLLVAIAAGLGAALGELSGYLVGFSGQGVIERTRWSDNLERWMRKYGDITIFILAFVPNPLFDMAGIIAGVLKYPLYRFLIWCGSGKILKMLIFAYLGDTIFQLLVF